jgi:uncharacterized repeat protein (TIGR03806 family)
LGALAYLLAGVFCELSAGVNILMRQNDTSQTSANTNETVLTPALVNAVGFGKIFSYSVDGYVYAQPLILTGVEVPGKGTHDLVFVATENDSLYAFDANGADGPNAAPVWAVSFINPAGGVNPVPNSDVGSGDIVPQIGITSTPVIDAVNGTIFVEVKTKETGAQYRHRLHALDVRTGVERPGSPVLINATSKGTGDGNDGKGNVPFHQLRQMNRCGLALVTPPGRTNSIVYLSYASHGDNGPYHGWALGYDSSSLTLVQSFNTTPNGGLGGLWMSGAAPLFDAAGNYYAITGNGTYNAAARNYGDSYIKLSTTGTNLALVDWFTPYNQNALNQVDADLGSGGAVLLPDYVGSAAHPHLLLGCGKEGRIYLLDRDSMGQFQSGNDSQIVQSALGLIGGTWSNPAFYRGRIYYQAAGDVMKAFSISNGVLSSNVLSRSSAGYGFPGATPFISANGTANGIAWALQTDGYGNKSPTILHAYDAENLAHELYNSSQSGSRDLPGPAVKFTVPTVANGKVYVGTANSLAVYGLGSWVAAPVIKPPGAVFSGSTNAIISDATPGAEIHYSLDGTSPTLQSPLYVGAITITNTVGLRARAFKTGMVASETVVAAFFTSSSIGHGTGLLGSYWSNHVGIFTGSPTLTRQDSGISFDWSAAGPDPKIGQANYTVRWTGAAQAQFDETYTFYASADDGVRLSVGGKQLVNGWVDQGTTEYSGSISLRSGQRYPIQLDYYQRGGGAVIRLEWSSPSTPRQFVPTSQLYLPNKAPVITLTSPGGPISVTGPATVTLSATASDPDGSIANVTFYNDNLPVGTVVSEPYSVTLTNLTTGNYLVAAVATDDLGATTSSGLVNIVVNAGSGNPFGITERKAFPAYLNLPHESSDPMPALLSETGAFSDVATMVPTPGLIPYTVKVPFWSDGAVKTRWIGVPFAGGVAMPANQVAFSPSEDWVFPSGSVFVKHFDLLVDETDPQSLRRLETRLLVSETNGLVHGATYRWRSDYSDADLVTSSLTEDIVVKTDFGSRTQRWYYPNSAECVQCHTVPAGGILGASKTRQLNCDYVYPGSQVADNQLRTLNHLGLLYPAIDESSLPGLDRLFAIDDTNATVELRARSYLDVNCSYCHMPGGTGRGFFDARLMTPLELAQLINGPSLTGLPGFHPISPGDELHSTIFQRIDSVNPLVRMPPIARNETDLRGVNLINNWIDSLAGPPPVLEVATGTDKLMLSWQQGTNTFYLQQNSGLAPGSAWVPGPTPAVNAGQATVEVSAADAAQYYRLTSQSPL